MRMNRLKILFACAVAFVAGSHRSDAQFALSVGAAFPGAIYTYNGYDGYYAKLRIGFDIGVQYNLRLTEYLDGVVSADFIRNGLGKMAKAQMGYNYSNYPSYLNFPVMLGLSGKIDFDGQGFLDPAHHAFLEVKGGVNGSTLSRSVFTDENGVKQTLRYGIGWAPAFSVGAGMRFSDHGSISIRFADLGNIRLKEKGNSDAEELRYSPRLVELRYSYIF